MKFPAKQLLAVAAVFGSGLGVSLGAAAATLNIVGCDSFSGDPTTGTITCVTGSTTPPSPPGAPSGCTASVSPTSLPATGGQVNLATASCTGGTLDDSMTKLKRNGVVVSRPDTLPSNSTSSTSAKLYLQRAVLHFRRDLRCRRGRGNRDRCRGRRDASPVHRVLR